MKVIISLDDDISNTNNEADHDKYNNKNNNKDNNKPSQYKQQQ